MVSAGRFMFGQSHAAPDDRTCEEPPAHDFRFPVYVLNLRHRTDRRAHMERMLHSIGFSNLIFPNTTAAADLDIPEMLRQGRTTEAGLRRLRARLGPAAVRPHLAHALQYLDVLAAAAAAGHPLFGVFEDDTSPGGCPAEAARRVAAALRELPADAGALYLEACFEWSAPPRTTVAKPVCRSSLLSPARAARVLAARAGPAS
jgi:hypothetical protein